MSNQRKKSTKSSASSQIPYNNDDVEDSIMEELWNLNSSQPTQSLNSTSHTTELPPGNVTSSNSREHSESNSGVNTQEENHNPSPHRRKTIPLSNGLETNQTPLFSQRRVVLRPITNLSNILRQNQPLGSTEKQTPPALPSGSRLNVSSNASAAEISSLQNLCKDILKELRDIKRCSDTDIKPNLSEIKTQLEEIKSEQRELKQKVDNLIQRSSQKLNDRPDCLPFKTLNDFESFDSCDDSVYEAVQSYFQYLGGFDADDSASHYFTAAFHSEEAISPRITWKGTRPFNGMRNSNFARVCEDAMSNNEAYQKPNGDVFSKSMNAALKALKERYRKRRALLLKNNPATPKVDPLPEDVVENDGEIKLRLYQNNVKYALWQMENESDNAASDHSQNSNDSNN